MTGTYENRFVLANSCVYYARQIPEIYSKVLPYSVDFKAPGELGIKDLWTSEMAINLRSNL